MRFGPLANESENYRKIRDELFDAEVALRDQRERVAALRRKLPLDTNVKDYVFQEGPADLNRDGPITEVRLSELFTKPDEALVVYQYMFGGAQTKPCTMCTLWVDGFNGIGHHLQQRLNFAIVAQAGIGELRQWARSRDWRKLRLISSAGTDFKTDFHFSDAAGAQWPGVSAFSRSPDGLVKHFYSSSALMEDAKRTRGIDLLTPFWNILDLTPEGRKEWMPKLEYGLANVQKH
jgi:predicted dithiol-disulfide oxidoreductase (DUF899 family)